MKPGCWPRVCHQTVKACRGSATKTRIFGGIPTQRQALQKIYDMPRSREVFFYLRETLAYLQICQLDPSGLSANSWESPNSKSTQINWIITMSFPYFPHGFMAIVGFPHFQEPHVETTSARVWSISAVWWKRISAWEPRMAFSEHHDACNHTCLGLLEKPLSDWVPKSL